MNWEDYPAEKTGIKFYSYYFLGLKKPVVIEALNQALSREHLHKVLEKLPEAYHTAPCIGETVINPIPGVNTKKIDGRNYVWVGLEESENGWKLQEETKSKS